MSDQATGLPPRRECSQRCAASFERVLPSLKAFRVLSVREKVSLDGSPKIFTSTKGREMVIVFFISKWLRNNYVNGGRQERAKARKKPKRGEDEVKAFHKVATAEALRFCVPCAGKPMMAERSARWQSWQDAHETPFR